MGAADSGSRESKLRVLVREVHYGDGVTARQLNVYCRRRGSCVPAQQCTTCSHCEGFTVDHTAQHSFLLCTYAPAPANVSAASGSDETEHDATGLAERTAIEMVMTKDVVCVTEDMAVEEVSRLILERGFSGVPVVNDEGKPIGVVSKTDLLREAHEGVAAREIEEQIDEKREDDLAELERYQLGQGFHTERTSETTVREVMTPITYSLRANTSVAQAAALMAFEGVHRLPIVAEHGGEIVGLLSALDILRWLGEQNGYLLRHMGENTGLVA